MILMVETSWEIRDSDHDHASFILFFSVLWYALFAASVFGTIVEVELIITVFLLCLNGIFLETNYDVKQVFWETLKYFFKSQ